MGKTISRTWGDDDGAAGAGSLLDAAREYRLRQELQLPG
jgi:hypothetical protein